jgi:hypothetical protein
MRRIKWPDGKIACPKCSGANIGEIATRHLLRRRPQTRRGIQGGRV